MPVVFAGIRAPSTLGTFLRTFTRGHALQLHAAHRRFLGGLAAHTPLLPSSGEKAFIDVDSTHKRVYGWAKQGAEYGRFKGSLNLLYRYITQGRAEGDRPVTTPRRLARLLLIRPDDLRDKDTELLRELTAACPEMTELARLVQEFAELLTPAVGNDTKLNKWITAVRACDLPYRGPNRP